jgi:peroxiredoxin
VPPVALAATDGSLVELAALSGLTVVFAYPRTGAPGRAVPAGWDAIPGARGCTPQACAYRDAFDSFAESGARVFGLSTQDTGYQREAVARLRLPYPLLSDAAFALTDALGLPTFEFEGTRLLRRLTLFVRDGTIEHVTYPVFPSDGDAAESLAYVTRNAAR